MGDLKTVPVLSPGRRAGGRRRGGGLWLAALAVSLALCGTENVSGGIKSALGPDQLNHLILTESYREALKELTMTPRVSPLLAGGLGNPYHQFYSPFAHAVPALLSFPLGGASRGHTAAALLFTALGFVYAWRLLRLLTASDAAATLGAFLFATAPYLLCVRALRGAWSEFAAFSLLPATVYFLLRGSSGGPFARLLPGTALLAALFLTHLISAFLLCGLLASFCALWALNAWRAGGAEGRPALRRLGRRAARIAAAGLLSAAMAACYLAPMALYGDLVLKHEYIGGDGFARSSAYTALLSLLSAADGREHYQLGAVLLLSFLAFLWLRVLRGGRARGKAPLFALPLCLAAATAAAAAFAPGAAAALFPPARIAQYSYRFIMWFALCSAPMGAMSLAGLFPRDREGAAPAGAGAACAAILLSAALAAPYLYPAEFKDSFPWAFSGERLRARGAFLSYGGNAYLRRHPGQAAAPDTLPPGLPVAGGEGTAAARRFSLDLAAAARMPGDGGAVPLDILYYPGLQDIRVRLDGREIVPEPGTFWQRRPGLGLYPPEEGWFHGLVIRGLPGEGRLEAEVRFTGMRAANALSAAGVTVWAGLALRAWASRRPRGRARAS